MNENENVKYDNDKMNLLMSERSECECFVGPEIPLNTGPPQSSAHLAQGK